MGVINIKPMWSMDESEGTLVDNTRVNRNSRLAWTVLVDDVNENSTSVRFQVMSTYGLTLQSQHPHDANQWCTSTRCRKISPILYMFEASYIYDGAGDAPGDNPLDEPPEIDFSYARSDEPIDYDVDGNPIITKTGEPVDPLCTARVRDMIITVSRNNADFDPVFAWDYVDAVNSDPFLGFPAGTVILDDVRSASVTTPDLIYFRTTTVLAVRKPGPGATNEQAWWQRRLHQGLYVLDAADKPVRAQDEEGEDVVNRILLDVDGKKEPDLTNPHFLFFKTVTPKALAPLGIL